MFSRHKGTDSRTGRNDLKIVFNKTIWRDDSLGELNIYLDGEIPVIELYKIFIWVDGNSRYFRIQICIGYSKIVFTLTIDIQDKVPTTFHWVILINNPLALGGKGTLL